MWPFRRSATADGSDTAPGWPRCASDLPIPIYLNQRAVFDLLAAFDDGFAQITDIRTSASTRDTDDAQGRASIGVGNPFALLGVSFGKSLGKSELRATQRAEQKVHTPTSLFAKLRRRAQDINAVRVVSEADDVGALEPGDFVEFHGIIRRNPFFDGLQGFKQLMSLAHGLATPGERKQSAVYSQFQTLTSQIDTVLSESAGSIDLVVEITGAPHLKAVVMADESYFDSPSIADVIDGEFFVFGKVTRAIKDADSAVSLLRKSTMGMFPREMMSQLADAFTSVQEAGIDFPRLDTEVRGPTLQVIPIAIFA